MGGAGNTRRTRGAGNPGGWRLGLGGAGNTRRTRGAGAPGGGGWDWVRGYPKEDPGGRSPGGLGGEGEKGGNGYAILKSMCKKLSGAPPLPRYDGHQRPTQWGKRLDHLLSRPVPSRPVLSCPAPSRPVLSCPVQSSPVLSCPVLSCPVLSSPVLFCPVPSCPVPSGPGLSRPAPPISLG